MNTRFLLILLALLAGAAFLPACSKAEAALTPEGVTEKVGEVTGLLNGITDIDSAKANVAKALPMMGVLETAKKALGDKMPSLSSLGGVVDTLKSKFAGKDAILGALKPIFDKIMALVK